MPTLELEKLGVESLENADALSQIVGGKQGNVTYRSYDPQSTNTSFGFVKEQTSNVVDAFGTEFGSTVYLGTMTRRSDGSYLGQGPTGLGLFAFKLDFDDSDIVYDQGIT